MDYIEFAASYLALGAIVGVLLFMLVAAFAPLWKDLDQ